MAMTSEERREDRLRRQRQRQEKAAKQKKLFIRLAIAAAVLLGCGVLILLVALNKPQTPDGSTTVPPTVSTPTVSSPADTQPPPTTAPTTTIHLVAGGDLNITDRVVASGGNNQDYTQAFLDVAHLLANGDITMLNFEGSFFNAPYGSATGSAPHSMLQALSNAGVDLVQLANSYAIRHGISGLAGSISAVKAAGMTPLGVYPDSGTAKAERGYVIRNAGGIRIAFVAFTKGMDGTSLPAGSEGCVNLLYTDYNSYYQKVDTEGISRVLDAVAAEKPDLVVAALHWGSEFSDSISASQKKILNLMQSKGVDVIIGTHPHFVHKMVFDQDAGTFVAYSLGDFFGDAQRAGTEYSVLLDLEITKDNVTGVTSVTNFSYTPIFTVAEENQPLRVVRIAEAMKAYEDGHINRVSKQTYDAMAYALKRIEARIKGE